MVALPIMAAVAVTETVRRLWSGGAEEGWKGMTFDEAMEGVCRAEERYGYRAEVLPGMRKRFGAVGAAKVLLKRTANWQYGFKKLRDGGHLHISVENLVLFGMFQGCFRKKHSKRLGAGWIRPGSILLKVPARLRLN